MQLSDFIGDNITAIVPFISKDELQTLKLHGVESGGIWVTSQGLTNILLKAVSLPVAPVTSVIFLPFHQKKRS